MNARALLMAALALVFSLGICAVRGSAAPERVLASWNVSMDFLKEVWAYRLATNGATLVVTERKGPPGGAVTKAMRYSLAFSDIGCVVSAKESLAIYPAKRWGVAYKNLLSGRLSPEGKLSMAFPDASHTQTVLRALESQSPNVRKKLDVCKDDVDLYGLRFGAVPAKTDPFTWTRNSMLGISHYTLWFDGGTLYEEVTDEDIHRHAFHKMTVSSIACVIVNPGSSGLAPSLAVAPALRGDVLELESTGDRKPATLTTGAISMTFDDQATQQDALQYLEGKDPKLSRMVKSSCF